jgi:hypothetical protein
MDWLFQVAAAAGQLAVGLWMTGQEAAHILAPAAWADHAGRSHPAPSTSPVGLTTLFHCIMMKRNKEQGRPP